MSIKTTLFGLGVSAVAGATLYYAHNYDNTFRNFDFTPRLTLELLLGAVVVGGIAIAARNGAYKDKKDKYE